jgi:hypothetical protein
MGNQMMQYMVADNVRSAVPDACITGFGKSRYCNNILKWGIDFVEDAATQGPEMVLETHAIDINGAIEFLKGNENGAVMIKGVSCRYGNYASHLARYREIFRPADPTQVFGADKLVINVRLGDALAGIHPFYPVLPISWYDHVIESSGLEPVFVGQFGDDPYTEALKSRYPGSGFYHSSDPLEDFHMLRAAANIVLPVSTFSWLAAWLSETVENIHFPIAGIFDPRNRPDVDMLPLGDERYQFYLFPHKVWKGSSEEVNSIINEKQRHSVISHSEVSRVLKITAR